MEILHEALSKTELLKSFLNILVPLLIIMDPLGNLTFFLFFTGSGAAASDRRRVAAVASLTACLILVVFSLTGDFLLRFFGITLPAFQIAGGFIFFIYALQLLNLIPRDFKAGSEEEREGFEKQNVALVPLDIPLLAGPGAITAVMVWRGTLTHEGSTLLLPAAILTACFLVYLTFHFGQGITRLLGVSGIRVLTRLMGLLLSVIAVQFMVKGVQEVF